ncbi:MAG: RNA 2',3'-cyclic phosphodiesterase [Verrucomicrobia bacterium]|nr:RNA 2',3'-cyclic phosphodiesterase [Verrucomicrobiota bacterium]MBU4289609.1 RNA 2',3'-cyclic phosphodiesterase [Verrucomicrobiota bacterium]MBU4430336.1 RNA 2',3'-cyclic phosphodiesterase [Verrucomicrobiota bacterium]MCG2680203.1 RNA 2',3'-cyclic phosphodiesterase [Kiritimatiellia bacterium]
MAVAIDEVARKELAEAQQAMKRIGAGVSWVVPLNIHVTLVFIGDIFETALPLIRKAIDRTTAHHSPGAMDIQGLGYFGRPGSLKVVWAGLQGNILPLIRLQADLVSALKADGFSPDAKPFKPHLTLGRVRSSRQIGGLVEFITARSDQSFGRLNVLSVLLMNSLLTPQGPIYSVLHKSPLKTELAGAP